MAISNAEKQKRWREKQKAIREGRIEPPSKAEPVDLSFLMDGFSEWIQADEDRREAIDHLRQEIGGDMFGYLIEGRPLVTDQIFTMNILGSLKIGLETLSGLLHQFRFEKIETEITRIEAEEFSKPDQRNRAIEKIVQLKLILKGMDRNYRIECAEYDIAALTPLLKARADENNAILT